MMRSTMVCEYKPPFTQWEEILWPTMTENCDWLAANIPCDLKP